MNDFIIFFLKGAIIYVLSLAAIYMAAYMFNSGWQASNYNFWKKKSRETKQEEKR